MVRAYKAYKAKNGSKRGGKRGGKKVGKKGGRTGVPELDPGAAGAATVLLLGGTAYLASRRRKQDLV